MQVHESLVDLIGNTPLVKLRKVSRHVGHGAEHGGAATVVAKVEYVNPGGSVKDRIALRMVEAAEQSGALRPGGTIVEPTSGKRSSRPRGATSASSSARTRSPRTRSRCCVPTVPRL